MDLKWLTLIVQINTFYSITKLNYQVWFYNIKINYYFINLLVLFWKLFENYKYLITTNLSFNVTVVSKNGGNPKERLVMVD